LSWWRDEQIRHSSTANTPWRWPRCGEPTQTRPSSRPISAPAPAWRGCCRFSHSAAWTVVPFRFRPTTQVSDRPGRLGPTHRPASPAAHGHARRA
jgi:hypothetical protein